jgi:hypothetical protein
MIIYDTKKLLGNKIINALAENTGSPGVAKFCFKYK